MSNLKPPKGTVDYQPKDAILYEKLIDQTKKVFKAHGAVPLDTPTFELRDVLMNKYGDDSKLIYDLKDTGGEICALRYDLTVPFARYMGCKKTKRIKRYQIGKVYRRDQPSVAKGRMREFIQADFDIAGGGIESLEDVEVLSCIDQLLNEYNIGDFIIKMSDRRILKAILDVSSVEEKLHGTICSTIDKIDKLTQEQICAELKEKGLNEQQISMIYKYIPLSGGESVLDCLKDDGIVEIPGCADSISNFRDIFKYARILGFADRLELNLSLARGLEYYTGIIIEAVSIDESIGSIAGGGRYDKLIASLAGSKSDIPCVGFSIGLSRIFNILSSKSSQETYTRVFVTSSNGLFLEERLEILSMLWKNGIPCETFYTKRFNVNEHVKHCSKKGIEFVLIIGSQEIEQGTCSILCVRSGEKKSVSKNEVIEFFYNPL